MLERNQEGGTHHGVARGDIVILAASELDKARGIAPGADAKPLLDFMAGGRVVVGNLIAAAKALCDENEALRAEAAATRAGLAVPAQGPPEEGDDA
jgi:hypothetical protein